MSEQSEITSPIKTALEKAGYFVLRIQSGVVRVKGGFMHLAPTGTADLLVFDGRKPLWVEAKLKGNKTNKKRAADQAEFRDRVLALGHGHVRAESLDDVLEALKAS
jgi:hypothetical protein